MKKQPSSHWNYRIMRHLSPKGVKGYSEVYGLHEVFYEGKTKSWTQEPICGYYKSKKELIESLMMMLKDARKNVPILSSILE